MEDTCCAEESEILILACAGTANVGQMTNQVAMELTEEGFGRYFCLAGIGAHLSGFVMSARDAEKMLVMDGCPIGCASKILAHADIPVKNCFVMTDMGMEKKHGHKLARKEINRIKKTIKAAFQGGAHAKDADPSPMAAEGEMPC